MKKIIYVLSVLSISCASALAGLQPKDDLAAAVFCADASTVEVAITKLNTELSYGNADGISVKFYTTNSGGPTWGFIRRPYRVTEPSIIRRSPLNPQDTDLFTACVTVNKQEVYPGIRPGIRTSAPAQEQRAEKAETAPATPTATK